LKDEASCTGKDYTNQRKISAPKTLLTACVLQEETSPAVERVSTVNPQEARMDLAVLSHQESRARG